MPNDRLRDAIMKAGLVPTDLAAQIGVDPKTAERWITNGRAPYPRHRHAIAAALGDSESYFWPDAVVPDRAAQVSESEVRRVYPHRSSIPQDLWSRLINSAGDNIDILVYVGMFLTEVPNLLKTFRTTAESGATIRLLFGNPTAREVLRRSEDEGIGRAAIPAKIRNVLAFFRPLSELDGVDVRCHGTTLYNSIYRFDDEMIVNPHVYGFTAPHAPALHLRRLSAGDLFATYAQSFERVWELSKPPKW